MSKISTTTKDIGLVHQLHESSQLLLAPEFQRNAVWPRAAKAYLIDTILSERPMPLFFFQRGRSAQTGKPVYAVVDGQQRLRAIFEFMEDRYALTESKDRRWKGKRFSDLTQSFASCAVRFRPGARRAGQTKYPLGRMVRFGLTGIVSLSRFPLRAAGLGGLVLLAMGLLAGAGALRDVLRGLAPPDRTLVLAAIGVVGGVQLVFLGVLGEYLGAVLDEVRARPHYVVEEKINFP